MEVGCCVGRSTVICCWISWRVCRLHLRDQKLRFLVSSILILRPLDLNALLISCFVFFYISLINVARVRFPDSASYVGRQTHTVHFTFRHTYPKNWFFPWAELEPTSPLLLVRHATKPLHHQGHRAGNAACALLSHLIICCFASVVALMV